MNDFNRGALPIPCLRLDYGFGEQWASVELGDGTGYVRLADYEKQESENAKLRDTTYAWRTVDRLSCENAKLRELALKNWYIALSEREALSAHGIDPDGGTYIAALDDEIATVKDRMRELGIEVDK